MPEAISDNDFNVTKISINLCLFFALKIFEKQFDEAIYHAGKYQHGFLMLV